MTKPIEKKTAKRPTKKPIEKKRSSFPATNKPFKANAKEAATIAVLKLARTPLKLSEIAAKAYPKKGTSSETHGNSWVRNSLRKPVAYGYAKQVGRGTYSLTPAGRAALAGVKKKAPAKKRPKPVTVGNSHDTGPDLASAAS